MTRVEQLAAFVARACYEDLSEEASRELKIRVLDGLGCAIGAIEGPPMRMLRAQLEDFGGNPLVTLIGGGKAAPDRAAFYNSAKEFYQVRPAEIERIEVEVFDVAYHIIGGGEEEDKHCVRTKEEAYHSLPYLVAVALLDGEVTHAQYAPERIAREDVQVLLRKVNVRPNDALSQRFPAEMPCRLRVFLTGSRILSLEKRDYTGFATRPFTWEQAVAKFERLASPYAERELRQAIVEAVACLETIDVSQVTELLTRVNRSSIK